VQRIAFSEAVTALSSGTTWKTTKANRHPLTDELILKFCSGERYVILDVGVSDGITALELIEKLNGSFEIYHATDIAFTTQVVERHGKAYFYDSRGQCGVVAAPSYVVYDSLDGALFPFSWLARRALSKAPKYDAVATRPLSLANPELRAKAEGDPRIVIQDYSVFDPWTGTPPDLIKIANVLNRDYFSDAMLEDALSNLKSCLKPDGLLVVTDNRDIERVSTFIKTEGHLALQDQVNGGCSVTTIATGL